MKRAWALVAVGVVAMAGDLLGLDALYGAGLATHASPAPKVFTARDGLEGFSASYTLRWEEGGQTQSLPLTPEVYARLQGPYNRRNVYGAALAGGPFLADHPLMGDLHERVVTYAFCDTDVLAELGVTTSASTFVLDVVPRDGTVTELPLHLVVTC